MRGVKNRVRAGIATFLQDQTAKVTFTFFLFHKTFHQNQRAKVAISFRFASTLIIIFSLEIHACHVCSSIELTKDPFWLFQSQPLTHTSQSQLTRVSQIWFVNPFAFFVCVSLHLPGVWTFIFSPLRHPPRRIIFFFHFSSRA